MFAQAAHHGSRFRPLRSFRPHRIGQGAAETKLITLERFLLSPPDQLELFVGARNTGARLVDARLFHLWFALLHRPSDIESVFIHQHEALRKSRTYQGLRIVLGDGLVTSEGELWKRQRQLVQSAFHHKSVVSFVPKMLSCARELTAKWVSEGPGPRDVHREMVGLTFQIIGETLFSTRFQGESTRLGELLETLLPFAEAYGIAIFRPPLWLPTSHMRKVRAALHELDRFVEHLLEERKGQLAKPDLLGRLMEAADETGGMSKQLLRDEIITLAAAGHETTASALTFCLYLLASHPATQEELHEEACSAVAEERAPDGDMLKALPLAERVIRESMRLFPPVWAFERVNTKPVEVDGHRIPAGTMISASPFSLHRDPSIYEDPLRFDPDRFQPEAVRTRPRHAYLPFGIGPRSCIGSGFAVAEAKLALSAIMRWVRVRHPDSALPLELIPHITLRPKKGLHLLVEPRSARHPN